jgi:glyceraldehyde 3-phosphate dehydrogenase
MTVRVGINGFGRIGRHFYRAVRETGADIEVVAANEIGSPEATANLLMHDSTHGRLDVAVHVTERGLRVGSHDLLLFSEPDPKALPWGELGVEVVVECSGRFRTRDAAMAHVEGGARRVVISAPSPDADATFVVGVNEDTFDPAQHVIVSNASCTTNCFVPMVKVLDDAFGVRNGLMTTVHAYTNDQNLLDLAHKDLRRSRAAAVNIVPASTGAARATGLVLQAMQGRLDGSSLRVPVPDGSITDFTAILNAEVTTDQINEAFREAASEGRLSHVLDYTEAPIVSTDIVGVAASCVFDSGLTMAMPIGDDSTLAKVFGWYDNEWGYSCRLVDLCAIVGAAG